MPDDPRPAALGLRRALRPCRLGAVVARVRHRTRRRLPGPDPADGPDRPEVVLYGFEAHGRWASAMLHNRSSEPIVDAAAFVVDDDRALLGRRDGITLAAGALAQVAFHAGGGVPPSPVRCFVEFTDPDGRPWVVGVDGPAPRPLAGGRADPTWPGLT